MFDYVSMQPYNENPELMRRVEVYTRRVAAGQDIWTGNQLPDDIVEDLRYFAQHREITNDYFRSVGRSRIKQGM